MKEPKKLKLLECFCLSKEELLGRFDKPTISGAKWWFWAGNENMPIICAHIDTVFERKIWDYVKKDYIIRNPEIMFDKKKGVFWSPDGLGADDRAGCYMAYWLKKTHGCSVALFDLEESGGVGSREACQDKAFLSNVSNYPFLIGLDRRGKDDAVFYNKEPLPFKKYIESFGFFDTMGSFSDIATISRATLLCGVNLSVGYYNQHSRHEFLRASEMFDTIGKVRAILNECDKKQKQWVLPKPKAIKYVAMTTVTWKGGKRFENGVQVDFIPNTVKIQKTMKNEKGGQWQNGELSAEDLETLVPDDSQESADDALSRQFGITCGNSDGSAEKSYVWIPEFLGADPRFLG